MNMERQNHGFKFEKSIMADYNIVPSTDYTAKWDGFLDGVPVSIKVERYGSDIELADFRRNATNTEDFYLIVGLLGHSLPFFIIIVRISNIIK